jgi:hypothetical protein
MTDVQTPSILPSNLPTSIATSLPITATLSVMRLPTNFIKSLQEQGVDVGFFKLSHKGEWIADVLQLERVMVPRFTSVLTPTVVVTAEMSQGMPFLSGSLGWYSDDSGITQLADDRQPNGCGDFNRIAIHNFSPTTKAIQKIIVQFDERVCWDIEDLPQNRLHVSYYSQRDRGDKHFIVTQQGLITPTSEAEVDALRAMVIRKLPDPNQPDKDDLVLINPYHPLRNQFVYRGENPVLVDTHEGYRLALVYDSIDVYQPIHLQVLNVDTKTIEKTFELPRNLDFVTSLHKTPTNSVTALMTITNRQNHLWFFDWRRKELFDYGEIFEFWGWRSHFGGFLVERGTHTDSWLEVIRP